MKLSCSTEDGVTWREDLALFNFYAKKFFPFSFLKGKFFSRWNGMSLKNGYKLPVSKKCKLSVYRYPTLNVQKDTYSVSMNYFEVDVNENY